MKACILTISYDALREKLGLPPTVRISTVGSYYTQHNEAYVILHGIGPDVADGDTLLNVSGRLRLETEKGLTWEIA